MGIGWSIQSTVSIFLALLLLGIVIFINRENISWSVDSSKLPKNVGGLASHCDFFSGNWVFDNKSYPLYSGQNCSYKDDGLACESAGRKDLKYQYWRWQPHNCELPRFNAIAMLERLRGKRLVFVGDSLTRNQWSSMVCLLESLIPEDLKSRHGQGNFATFRISGEYNTTIEHYWSPFLVESNSDGRLFHHAWLGLTVRVQAIEKHARHWTDADILVFNSYLWWRKPKMNVLWGSFDSPDNIHKKIDRERSYEMALQTWSDWLEVHVNHTRTQSFFVTMSATHERGEDWGKPAGQNCYNETEPILKEGYSGNGSIFPKMMRILKDAIDGLRNRGVKVQVLNITQLTEYRKEGHPSIYTKRRAPLTKEELANPGKKADCVHWCLPGVADVWNELFYAYLLLH